MESNEKTQEISGDGDEEVEERGGGFDSGVDGGIGQINEA